MTPTNQTPDPYGVPGEVRDTDNPQVAVAFNGRHVDSAEAMDAMDPAVGAGDPSTAPWERPAPASPEPVAVAGAAGTVGVVVALLAAGVPVLYAVALAAFLAALTAWTRSRVTPYH